ACYACRQRKSQCKVEPEQPLACMMCRSHGSTCVFPPSRPKAQKRRYRRQCNGPGDVEISQLQTIGVEQASVVPHSDTGHGIAINVQSDSSADGQLSLEAAAEASSNQRLIGPVLASDDQHLSKLMEDKGVTGTATTRTVFSSRHGSNLSAPIVFTPARRRPVGLHSRSEPAQETLDIIKKLVEPWEDDLLKLYVAKAEICCPLLSKKQLHHLLDTRDGNAPPALLACLLAHSLTFWSSSQWLSSRRPPDQRFIWNLANEALFLEMRVSPKLSTIAAVLLNVGGRPTSMVFNNSGQLGFAISVAYTLGLNRDPTEWDIPPHEKEARMNLWRGLLLYDRWQSLAHGSPPHIQTTYFDVPTIEPSTQLTQHTVESNARSIYEHLLTLTENVLSPHLCEINRLATVGDKSFSSNDQRHDSTSRLQEWMDSSTGVSRSVIIRGTDLSTPGAANLRLAFLIIQFLDRRLNMGPGHEASGQSGHYQPALRAAEDVVFFLQELGEDELQGYWMPTMGFALLMVMTFLIRSVLDTDPAQRELNQPLGFAQTMMECLREHRKRGNWDIADLCLGYYDQALQKI
ncbi:hypothetical protein M409DRAFT_33112, partial [Zasmidium cellare ATCC 36951]